MKQQPLPLPGLGVLVACAASAAVLIGCSAPDSDEPTDSIAWRQAPQAYQDAIIEALNEHGCPSVDRNLVAAQFQEASAFDPPATSAVGAQGPAQILPAQWAKWAPRVGAEDPHNLPDPAKVLVAMDCDAAEQITARGHTPTPRMIAAVIAVGMDNAVSTDPDIIERVNSDGGVDRIISAATPEPHP